MMKSLVVMVTTYTGDVTVTGISRLGNS